MLPRRLLFLISDTGGGHRAAATAVAECLETSYPGLYKVEILDPFARTSPRILGATARLYGPLSRSAGWMWAVLYHASDSAAMVRLLRASVLRTAMPAIRAALAGDPPALVVSFHPLLNHPAVDAVREMPGVDAPIVTVITDLVSVHSSWICPEVDHIVAPTPEARDRCLHAGMAAHRVSSMGLPVSPEFTPCRSVRARAEIRRRLGLDPRAFCVLLCSGADGSGPIVQTARAIQRSGIDLQLVVVCGRNRRARAELERMNSSNGRPPKIHGFVDNMAEFMQAADVVVTKAGPATIAEALCCSVPLLLTWHLPGQETANVEWVVDTGAGLSVPESDDLIQALSELASPRSSTLARMRAAARRAAQPNAAFDIAHLIARAADGEARLAA